MPDVTIGLPVRNGAPALSAAISSLLSQTYGDFILVISDNESSDETAEICEKYASQDSRIRYFRQEKNLGNPGNFRFTLMQAQTPFFMWAAHDDVWSPTFLEKNRHNLEKNPTAVASISKVLKIMPSGERVLATGTSSISGNQKERLQRFFATIGDASRFYAVFRTEAIKQSFPDDVMIFGFDWIVMALNLLQGEHLELDEVLLTRQGHPDGHYFRTFLKIATNPIDRMVPYRPLTRRLREKLPTDVWKSCRWTVFRLGLVQIAQLAKHTYPVLGPIVHVAKAIDNKLRSAS